MADAAGLKPVDFGREGSIPSFRTKQVQHENSTDWQLEVTLWDLHIR